MRAHLVVIFALLNIWLSSAFAQSAFPKAGVCEYREKFEEISIHWNAENATVTRFGKTSEGELIGMREHSDGFRFSIFYEDSIIGSSEIAVFQIPNSIPPEYRLAKVSYDILPDGTRVISSLHGFNDAICAVVR